MKSTHTYHRSILRSTHVQRFLCDSLLSSLFLELVCEGLLFDLNVISNDCSHSFYLCISFFQFLVSVPFLLSHRTFFCRRKQRNCRFLTHTSNIHMYRHFRALI